MKIENRKLKVAILTGGIGTEREISLQSGQCVANALKQTELDFVLSDINPDNLDILQDSSIDVFFISLHGQFGEDGQLQQILEDKNLCYIGSGLKTCKLAIDKLKSKQVFKKAGVDTPKAIRLTSETNFSSIEQRLSNETNKYVVKPITHGSSVGVNIVNGIDEAISAGKKCLNEFGECMIEQFIPGREITVGILCDQILPIIEISPKQNFYDYRAKYLDDTTEYLFDTIDDESLASRINASAMKCFKAIGCKDFGRVDFIVGQDSIPYVLEVNAIPGLTNHSCLPKAAARVGLGFSDLCVKLIKSAFKEKNKNTQIISTISGGQEKTKKQISAV